MAFYGLPTSPRIDQIVSTTAMKASPIVTPISFPKKFCCLQLSVGGNTAASEPADAARVRLAISDLSQPLLAAVTGQFDQQVAPREHSLHTNFPAVELSLAQIGQLVCDRMFPFVGHDLVRA
jgi:hypothetical protein